ncbi:MAG: winged helix-turn-helix domain-containing protein [Sphingomonadaceae bacterium]
MRSGKGTRRRRRFSFGNARFDEGAWALSVAGEAVPLEAKPAELLHVLLLRAGEVVTKDELLDLVWPGVHVVEASLSVAVSKLRRALGDEGGAIIETVPRFGYRLAADVKVESLDAPLPARFAFQAGDAVPGRPQWLLDAPLGQSGAHDVWRARHAKTGETRVFKFADAPDRLLALKREAALARLLAAALGPRGPIVPIHEWGFDTAPYWLEFADGGGSLLDWAQANGGLAAMSPERRLAVGVAMIRALASVHGAGVLHKDLKPANVLIEERRDESGESAFRVRLADFGSGDLVDGVSPEAFGITGLPFREPGADSGTAGYRAPELMAGGLPTVKSDIWAAGLILFQLVAGDFRASLSPGWREAVSDPLLREDIAAACAGDPAARPASAAELAQRLEQLEGRREGEARGEAERARMAALQEAEARRAARRPWVRAALAAGLVGLVGTSVAGVAAVRQRDAARAQAAIAEASYAFLADDLLARVDPALADSSTETVTDAVRRASAEIAERFADAPLVAGRLQHSVARGLAERADEAGAEAAFAAAIGHYGRAGDRQAAATAAFQRVLLHARGSSEGHLDRAAAQMAQTERAFGAAAAQQGVPGVWAAAAEGFLALAQSRGEDALTAFQRGATLAGDPSLTLSDRERIAARQRLLYAQLRMDQPDVAAAEALAADATRLLGADDTATLTVRLTQAQMLMQANRHEEAVAAFTAILVPVEARFGADHPRTLNVLGGRADSLKNLGRYAEAASDAGRIHEAAVRRFGAGSFYAVGSLADQAQAECRAGDRVDGIAHAMAAHAAAARHFGAGAALTHGASARVAECLIAAGRHAEALGWLQGLDRKAVGELVGNADWGLHVELLLAEIAASLGQPDAARQHYANAAPAFADLGTDAYEARRIAAVAARLAPVAAQGRP